MLKPIWRWLTYIPKLPEEWRSEFFQEMAAINHQRILIFVWIGVIPNIILLVGIPNLQLPPRAEFIQACLHISHFVISLITLILIKKNPRNSTVLVWGYLFLVNMLGYGFVINLWQNTAGMSFYLVLIFLNGGLIYLPNRINLIFYGISYLLLLLSISIFPVNEVFTLSGVRYDFFAHSMGAGCTLMASYTMRTLFAALRENFVLRKYSEIAKQDLQLEQDKSEKLLLNILPESIALRLKEDQGSIADGFTEVTVLFADIVGFTEITAKISAHNLVDLLNQIFSAFDALAEFYNLEKIKTIGDAYMVVGGLPLPRADHAQAIANMALDMGYVMNKFSTEGQPFQLRIGISSGPVVAGVIGTRKYIYDLWGDTVNIASRMESHGMPGRIQLCSKVSKILQPDYEIEERGLVQLKGKGEMYTYWLVGKKDSFT